MIERYYSNDNTIMATRECMKDENGKELFSVYYNHDFPVYEWHQVKCYSWARGLHGNAPARTPYGYFNATKNGKRVIITV